MKRRVWIIAAAWIVLSPGFVAAAPPKEVPKCDRCGATDCCLKKFCKPVPVELEVKDVCFDCKCEDFCVPGRSCLIDTICHEDDCGCWVERVWKPTCAEVRTRKVMVKKEVVRKSQSFNWEMQRLCPACACLPPAPKGTPPGGQPRDSGPGGEEIEEMQPEDQSVEEVELSSLPRRPAGTPLTTQSAPAPAPAKRSFWAFWR
ncbi:MAG: hypothetical protein JNG90_06670 [Planctomycetaceae bacterium]|nr:hypothetical protein [Planctomycetaceae bacterium]